MFDFTLKLLSHGQQGPSKIQQGPINFTIQLRF